MPRKKTPLFLEENAGDIEKRLASMGADLLVETLNLVETGKATYTKQDEREVTFAPKLKKEDGLIPWSHETKKIHNLIRGLTPSPGAYTYCLKNDTKEKKELLS